MYDGVVAVVEDFVELFQLLVSLFFEREGIGMLACDGDGGGDKGGRMT